MIANQGKVPIVYDRHVSNFFLSERTLKKVVKVGGDNRGRAEIKQEVMERVGVRARTLEVFSEESDEGVPAKTGLEERSKLKRVLGICLFRP